MGIVVNDTLYGRMIAQAAAVPYNLECDHNIARVKQNKLYGGVTYTGYTGRSIQMHTAGFVPSWANRDFLWMAFHYPFEQLGCETVFGQVSTANTRALEIDLKLGFKMVAKVEGVFPDGDCVVLAMKKHGCRWLQIRPRGVLANR